MKKDKKIYYPEKNLNMPDADSQDEIIEESSTDSQMPSAETDARKEKSYVLVWYESIVLGQQIIYPGDEIEEKIFRKLPMSLRIHFWEKGMEVPEKTYNKLSSAIQKKFKIQKGG